jgi:hypothetical protein
VRDQDKLTMTSADCGGVEYIESLEITFNKYP